jgi:hypothetical protein
MTKTFLKTGVAALALGTANAYAFYGTHIENYKPNPWLERPVAERSESEQNTSAAGATRRTSEVLRERAPREDLIERLWRESARTSSQHGA